MSCHDVPFVVGVHGVYGNPTLRAMHSIHKCVAKALHIYWQFSAMSHAIHKIVSKKRCQSYFISRRSPHHGKNKTVICEQAPNHGSYFAYARLIARVNSQFTCLVHLSMS